MLQKNNSFFIDDIQFHVYFESYEENDNLKISIKILADRGVTIVPISSRVILISVIHPYTTKDTNTMIDDFNNFDILLDGNKIEFDQLSSDNKNYCRIRASEPIVINLVSTNTFMISNRE